MNSSAEVFIFLQPQGQTATQNQNTVEIYIQVLYN